MSFAQTPKPLTREEVLDRLEWNRAAAARKQYDDAPQRLQAQQAAGARGAQQDAALRPALTYNVLGRVGRVFPNGVLLRRDVGNLLGNSSWKVGPDGSAKPIKTSYVPNPKNIGPLENDVAFLECSSAGITDGSKVFCSVAYRVGTFQADQATVPRFVANKAKAANELSAGGK